RFSRDWSSDVCSSDLFDMARQTKLARAIQLALLTGVTAGGVGVVSTAYAQQPELEEITVTGSRIRVSDLDTPRPVLMITRADMEIGSASCRERGERRA